MAKTMAVAVVLFVMCAFGTANASNLISDGGFTGFSGSYSTYNSGSVLPGGYWAVTSGSVDIIGTYWQSPVTGQGTVDLDGNSPGAISQTFATTAGTTYTVTFSLSGNPDAGSSTKSVLVNAGGTSKTFTYTTGLNSEGNMLYVTETLTFTATGSSTTLSFASQDASSSAYGAVIGNVSVTATPIPSALLLFGPGLAGLVGLRRRFKK